MGGSEEERVTNLSIHSYSLTGHLNKKYKGDGEVCITSYTGKCVRHLYTQS